MSVIALGYVVLNGPVDQWRTFATDVVGLQLGQSPSEDQLWLRMDERAYRFVIEEGEPGLGALGLEVTSSDDLDRVGERLSVAGIAVEESPALASKRHVRRLLTCLDPTGNPLELFFDAEHSTTEFASPRGVRFVTGDMGLGHVVMPVLDRDKVVAVYTETLGFRVSDAITFGENEAVFLHCNKRHHTVAFFGNVPIGPGIQHVMVELDSLEGVGRALDNAVDAGVPISLTLGEHSNDRMISFYCRTPSGNDIEIGWNGLQIDDASWLVKHYTSATLWGHKREEFSFATVG